MDGFYTVKEVCLKLHIARETLRRWEHDDWFPKRIRFRGTLGADGQHGILLPARGLDSPGTCGDSGAQPKVRQGRPSGLGLTPFKTT
jgi:hypothetical protein